MLHIFKINVPDRTKWGSVIQRDFILPSKIKSIKGFFVNVIPNENSKFRVNDIDKTIKDDVQVASVALSLNNTDVITASTPAMALAYLPNNTINKNMVKLSQKKAVEVGSSLRIIIEEMLKTPFVKKGAKDIEDYFEKDTEPTNSYTLKVYLDYDK